MYIYNITTNVEWSIHEAWLQWMLDIHIPEVLGTGCFSEHKFVRLLGIDETDGPTYAVQYYAETRSDYNRYAELYSASLMRYATERWGDKIITFGTLMQIVH